jgi:hypothetical protein
MNCRTRRLGALFQCSTKAAEESHEKAVFPAPRWNILIVRLVLLLLPEIIDALRNGRRWSGGYIGGVEVATGQQSFVTAQNSVKKIENKTYKNFNVKEVRECLIILMAYFYKAS